MFENEFAVGDPPPETLLDVLKATADALRRAEIGPGVAQRLVDSSAGRGPAPEAEQAEVDAALRPIAAAGLGGLPDVPREDMFRLLEDPLGAATRAVRRNLVVASGISLFVGLSPALPSNVPGFALQFGAAGWLVLVALGLVVLWELASFWLYFDNDRRRLRIADEAVGELLVEMGKYLAEVQSLLPVVDRAREGTAIVVRARVKAIVAIAGERVGRYRSEVRSVQLRRFLDGWAPFVLAGLAVTALVCRLFCWFPSVPFGWIDAHCG